MTSQIGLIELFECVLCKCLLNPTMGVYYVDLKIKIDYKKPQLQLVQSLWGISTNMVMFFYCYKTVAYDNGCDQCKLTKMCMQIG